MTHSRSVSVLLTILILNSSILTHTILMRSAASVLQNDCITSDAFRQQDLPTALYEKMMATESFSSHWSDILTTSMLNSHFHPRKLSFYTEPFYLYKKKSYLSLRKYYEAIWKDLRYFPVAGSNISFENSWMAPRNYGGSRHHEGTDLFGRITQPGYYPIISMTDGTIEQKGWLPLGGYRIGIRSPSGGYFYYAHLSSYAGGLIPGDQVSAGDILGFMGNTGYGREGTSGKFPVHLHLGIYISAPGGQEISVNPYPVLCCLRKNIRKYRYY